MVTEDGTAELPGFWLRRQREAAGLTQEELAERSRLSVRTISNLERGRARRPYPRSVRLLASALGLPDTTGDDLVTQYWAVRNSRTTATRRVPSWQTTETDSLPPVRRASLAVPRQLPPAVVHFAGRLNELRALDGLLEQSSWMSAGAVVISVISGTAGVGKTALAVHWAHQIAERFRDGQLHVNLRGFDPSGSALTSAQVIRVFLDALAVPAAQVPVNPDAQAALYLSLLADKHMLIVLDNARDAAQVAPLLPANRRCLVLITSRNKLEALSVAYGAHLLTLDVLSEAGARELLAGRLGISRAGAEPQAIAELARLCARLPLALAVAAAHAASRPQLLLAALAAELRVASGPLDASDTGYRMPASASCSTGPPAAHPADGRGLGECPGGASAVPSCGVGAG
jgi:transcriptional regulator with XRE-family HTH domain